jgi:hypothetical protein
LATLEKREVGDRRNSDQWNDEQEWHSPQEEPS